MQSRSRLAHLSRGRPVAALLVTLLIAALVPLATAQTVHAGPVASTDETYLLCGRAFPDPQAYWVPTLGEDTPAPGQGTSPWAKGNTACKATSFIGHEEALDGLGYLAQREDTGPFIEIINLAETDDPAIRAALDEEMGDGFSAGLPLADGSRDVQPLHLIKVTAPEGAALVDGVTPIPEADREHFVFPLSIHGIERAGVEGGIRAIEDLATWGALEPTRRVLETYDSDTITTLGGQTANNLSVGEILMRSVSYFVLANPDGWRRGTDADQGLLPADIPVSFQRYNGNGMDMNRDWPALGYTEHPYTPWSEPETRSFGKALEAISDQWTGGIDLHGQLTAVAFSYTLIGGSQRPYGKNERVQQFVEEAYADAEIRLAWSSLIKPNDNDDPADPRLYGVQYGTIWDTLDYTVSGAFGDWIDSSLGLNADGIDNEMSLSHLGNCGTGTCYLPEAEQLHVDGNKSLIYGMLNFNLQPPTSVYDLDGTDVAYLFNPRRLASPEIRYPTAPAGATPNNTDILGATMQHVPGTTTTLAEFDIVNDATTFTGGISATVTHQGNLGGQSGSGALNELSVQRQADDGTWVTKETYFNQAPTYVQAGQRVDENHPTDGRYRVVMEGFVPASVTYDVRFSTEPAWPEVGQDPYNVSNMDLFDELEPFLSAGSTFTAVDPRSVIAGDRDLGDFDTVIAIDDAFLPGYVDDVGAFDSQPPRSGLGNIRDDLRAPDESGKNDLADLGFTQADLTALTSAVDGFVRDGGNLVLTDDSVRALEWLGYTDPGSVHNKHVYATHVSFNIDGEVTYDHPLAADIDRPGAAEGTNNRRQTGEPVPIGYCVDSDQTCRGDDDFAMPQWYVDRAAWVAGGGVPVGGEGTGGESSDRIALGEMPVGDGLVRILGGLQPFPTTEFDHQFGLSSYAVTDSGYVLMRNLMAHENPAQNAEPDLTDDDDDVVTSPGSNALPAGLATGELPGDPQPRPVVLRYGGQERIETAVLLSRGQFDPEEGRNVVVATAGAFPDAIAGGPGAFQANAPVLLTRTATLPDDTRAEIRRLQPERIFVLGQQQAVSDAVFDELDDLALIEAVRLGGTGREETAAQIAERFFTGTGGTVYVAPGGTFAQAMAAGPVAGVQRRPILLVRQASIPEATTAQLERLQPDRIVIVGDTDAVSAEVEQALGAHGTTERLSAADATGISLVVSQDTFEPTTDTVYLTTAANFPDGLAGGSPAAFDGAPVLLVGDQLGADVQDEIRRLGAHRVIILGGPAAVSEAVEQAVRDLLDEQFADEDDG